MKEIVIKIPEDMYRAIKDDTYCGVLHLTLYDAIKNGKELPKGHGRLIDADALLAEINQFDYYDNVKEAPTIIEADKENDE